LQTVLGTWNGSERYLPHLSLISAAKAVPGEEPLIAAVNRCATQNQVQRGSGSDGVVTIGMGQDAHHFVEGRDLEVQN
jgi:hypothetical protein